MADDGSMTEGRPLRTCPICRATFQERSVVCWRCEAKRPHGVVRVTWTGGSTAERMEAREVLDLELNTRTFYGTITAELDWNTDGRWRVKTATIIRPAARPSEPAPEPEDGRPVVVAALESGGLKAIAM